MYKYITLLFYPFNILLFSLLILRFCFFSHGPGHDFHERANVRSGVPSNKKEKGKAVASFSLSIHFGLFKIANLKHAEFV